MIQALFSDVDQTILTKSYHLPETVATGFRLIRKAGVEPILATARSPKGVAPICKSLGVQYAICFNGAWIGEPLASHTMFDTTIERGIALDLMAEALRLGLTPLWYRADAVYAVLKNDSAEHEANITGETLHETGTLDALPAQPFKIMCTRPDLDPGAFETLRQRFSLICEITASNSRLLEITPKGISKGTAAAHLAAALGIVPSRCAAVGDGENDLSLLRWAGMALSVENAIPEIKGLAKFTGPSAEDGGLARVFDWLLGETSSHPIA